MAGGFDKQAASRPVTYQVLQFTGTAAGGVASSKFGVATQQIRVMSQLSGWGTINQTTSDTIIAAGGVGFIVTGLSTGYPAAVTTVSGSPYPEYCTVTPGQLFVFNSTTTSSGAISITEMA